VVQGKTITRHQSICWCRRQKRLCNVDSCVHPSHGDDNWIGESLIQYIEDHPARSVLFPDHICFPVSVQRTWSKNIAQTAMLLCLIKSRTKASFRKPATMMSFVILNGNLLLFGTWPCLMSNYPSCTSVTFVLQYLSRDTIVFGISLPCATSTNLRWTEQRLATFASNSSINVRYRLTHSPYCNKRL